jgi:glycosyltransferase involved in cell wall biosynthesis
VSAPEALFVGLRGFGFAKSRAPLIRALRERGWQVAVFANRDAHAAEIEAIGGVEWLDAGFGPSAVAPLADFRALRALKRRLANRPPALLHLFNAKPMLLGLLALRGLPKRGAVVATVTGLGHAFVRSRLVRGTASALYRNLLGKADAVVFQNPDDLAHFVAEGLVARERARLIVGSGVDTDVFRPAPRDAARATTVLMATRLLVSKGVLDYLDAAGRLRNRAPSIRFLLAGEAAPGHPDAIAEDDLRGLAGHAGVEYLGYRSDLPALLPQADLLVHPSYYAEGVPRILLEAAAAGVASITTDLPGCREAVVQGETGLLVPPRDPERLAREISGLAADSARVAAMGRAARRLAESRFDIRAVTAAQLALYDALGAGKAT